MTEEEKNSNGDANDKEEIVPDGDQAGGVAPPEQQEEIKDGLKSTPVVYLSAVLTMLFVLGIYDFVTSRWIQHLRLYDVVFQKAYWCFVHDIVWRVSFYNNCLPDRWLYLYVELL